MWFDFVRGWLDAQDRSQSWLGRKAGINGSYLSLLLNGHRKPGPKVIRRMERVLELKPGVLRQMVLRDFPKPNFQGEEHTPA